MTIKELQRLTCDRCKRTIEAGIDQNIPRNWGIIYLQHHTINMIEYIYHVCPSCCTLFLDWVKMPQDGEQERIKEALRDSSLL